MEKISGNSCVSHVFRFELFTEILIVHVRRQHADKPVGERFVDIQISCVIGITLQQKFLRQKRRKVVRQNRECTPESFFHCIVDIGRKLVFDVTDIFPDADGFTDSEGRTVCGY